MDDRDYRLQADRARADVRRLEARASLQEITLDRHRDLHRENHVSRQALDEVEAEQAVLREELAGARLAERVARRDLERTRIEAPFDGEVEARRVSEGDYVQAGTALYRLETTDVLQVRAAFPESVADSLEVGMPLRLTNRSAGDETLETEVDDIRPGISSSGRAVWVIARVENPGGWRSGASLDVELVLEERRGLVVPRQALVQRPDGDTLYILDEDRKKVTARRVEVGQRTADGVEILEGLSADEAVAVDGAGFLTDGASVKASPRDEASS
ncbi:MAG: efflux RND transporter periplasmic adaptor subunit [Ectothiorhodospira sp.]